MAARLWVPGLLLVSCDPARARQREWDYGFWNLASCGFPVLIAAGRHVWLRLTAELEEMGGGGRLQARGRHSHGTWRKWSSINETHHPDPQPSPAESGVLPSGQCWQGLLTEGLSWTLGKGRVFGGKPSG